MQTQEKQLWKKLIVVIVIKLVIILAIYWLFMRTDNAKINDTNVEKHLLSQATFKIDNDV